MIARGWVFCRGCVGVPSFCHHTPLPFWCYLSSLSLSLKNISELSVVALLSAILWWGAVQVGGISWAKINTDYNLTIKIFWQEESGIAESCLQYERDQNLRLKLLRGSSP